MGIDLQVLATNFRERSGEFLATATLRFDRDTRLLAIFAATAEPCVVQPVPTDLKIGHYDDEGLRFDTLDRFGNQLTYTTPLSLRMVRFPGDLSAWNTAIVSFLMALPQDVRLVLYWC